ncbi:hypothetical protein GLOTRDRAFT_141097 [Gloeophyllum trabeum ATCC 11539]|uniref:mRNA export factor GLE1 n=1 Tax=Gloeophyllum trabeum (strain ATCC 11539 / FP-39264 / Madison 617) TaxID=670483 RepID=S7PV22_GLOTA|nr:uncharacterized protein GLOTRDRAFT_141097 [Gloeophyllum trabeum ATCC 11539]EPQ51338.1 hypothetical protein GLOTRDRAFT_141097 [Gloeophyllum trabeum ATCC 11539]
MHIKVPRTVSPSPVRRNIRQGSTFGVPKDDEWYDSDSNESESASSSSSSSDSFFYDSEPEETLPITKPKIPRTDEEIRAIEEAVNSIRIRTRHSDPYEEWERKTKEEALVSARRAHALLRSRRRKVQEATEAEEAKRLAALHKKQMEEVEARIAKLQMEQQSEEEKLREAWKARDKRLWERIEAVIKAEEDKVKAKLEADRKAKEEAEKKKREEEERRRQEEERKRKEAEEARLKKEREETEAREQQAKEEEQKRKEEEMTKAQAEKLKQEEKEREALGMTTAEDDWRRARDSLKRLKGGPMKTVKSNKELKSAWGKVRREITPKIGQLTNDTREIDRISHQIVDMIRPTQRQSGDLYYACLSSLAKAILLQAETEVTAEKRSALPLVQVTVNMLSALESFGEIFFAKLCQRSGGWPIPAVVPSVDVDGTPFDAETRKKAMGYRAEESQSEFATRLAGMMRVYFAVLVAPVQSPLDKMFQLPRVWTYFARMLSTPQLLSSPIAPSLLHIALDVGGIEAKHVFGKQWVKMMELLYEGVTTGIGGASERVLGGSSPEGKAARVRVQLEIERVMSAP